MDERCKAITLGGTRCPKKLLKWNVVVYKLTRNS